VALVGIFGGLSSLGAGLVDIPGVLERARAEEQRERELADACAREAAARSHWEEALAGLVSGRLTLSEAVGRCRRFSPELLQLGLLRTRFKHPELAGEELLFEMLIDWAQEDLCDEPDRCMAVVARLQREKPHWQ
jgi:hypothetical protein